MVTASRLSRLPNAAMPAPAPVPTRPSRSSSQHQAGGTPSRAFEQKYLHQHFVILDAINNELAGESSTLPEADPSVERLPSPVRCANLNCQLLVPGLTCERFGDVPQLPANTQTSPLWQQKRTDLTDVSHRREGRPQIEALESDDASVGIDGYVEGFSRRKEFEVASLLFNRPHAIDGGMDAFRNHGFENSDDASSIWRHRLPHVDALHNTRIVTVRVSIGGPPRLLQLTHFPSSF